MTELERILKNTLTVMERELTATQNGHSTALNNQQRTLEAHSQAMHRLQEAVSRIEAEQQESAQHLQRLNDIHTNLEPLLVKLNTLLNGK